ncbi:hypothetical protein BDV24DRAFT_129256 [Aspergillus arachidicola]|uniref:Uncharacterized protein n=1 Tax=Aspergillus arachidicola TaxID=656916 RepID=A0A5N6YG72_9EURO|nr:hypothetical protein BDV24DRAFT_129256 [Aspergillus arachidicola]
MGACLASAATCIGEMPTGVLSRLTSSTLSIRISALRVSDNCVLWCCRSAWTTSVSPRDIAQCNAVYPDLLRLVYLA